MILLFLSVPVKKKNGKLFYNVNVHTVSVGKFFVWT